jgi:multidrug resistance efflux pump
MNSTPDSPNSPTWSASWWAEDNSTYETAPCSTFDGAVEQATIILSTYDVPVPFDGAVVVVNSHTGEYVSVELTVD